MTSAALTFPLTNPPQADHKPRPSYSGSQAVQSGTPLQFPCAYWIVNVQTATSMTFAMLDGSNAALGVLPVGLYIFDFQATTVTIGTPANATVTGFYKVGGI